MYTKFTEQQLNEKELDSLNLFKLKNPDKDIKLYYSTYDTIGIGFRIIASTDIPKVTKLHGVDFGNCMDITDYDFRIDQY